MESADYMVGKKEKCRLYGWEKWKVPILWLGRKESADYMVGKKGKCRLYGWEERKVPVIF
jgi:hypothetical protein